MNDSQYARSTSHAAGWAKNTVHVPHSKVGNVSQVDKFEISKDSIAGTSVMLTPNNPTSFQYQNQQVDSNGKVGRKELEISALA